MKYGFHLVCLSALLATLASASRPINRCRDDKDCNGGCCLYDGTVSLEFGFCDSQSSCSSSDPLSSSQNLAADSNSNRRKRDSEAPVKRLRTNNRASRNFDGNSTSSSAPVTTSIPTSEVQKSETERPTTKTATTVAPASKVTSAAAHKAKVPSTVPHKTKAASTVAPSSSKPTAVVSSTDANPTVTSTAKAASTVTSASTEASTPSSKTTVVATSNQNSTKNAVATTGAVKNGVRSPSPSNERNIVIPDAPALPVDLDIVNSFLKPFAPLLFASGFVGLPIAVLALTVLAPPPFPPAPTTTTAAPTTTKAPAPPRSPWDVYGAARPAPAAYPPQQVSYVQSAVQQTPMRSYDQPQRMYKRRGLIGDIIRAFSL